MSDGRVLNSELGMRNAECGKKKRGQSFEFGMRNSECGMRKEKKRTDDREQETDDREQRTDDRKQMAEEPLSSSSLVLDAVPIHEHEHEGRG
jgi:hypothetical protein